MNTASREFVYRHRIKISREDMELLRAGRKKCTIRLGKASVATPEIMMWDGQSSVNVRILRIDSNRRLGELTDRDAMDEGFSTREELLNDLRRFYPSARPDALVTVIYFEVVHDSPARGGDA